MENRKRNNLQNLGRRFDEDFKREAVAMIERGDRDMTQLARELGVSAWSLRRWRTQYRALARGGGSQGGGEPPPLEPVNLEVENRRLQRELDTVSRQRDILKKALCILSQEPPSSMK